MYMKKLAFLATTLFVTGCLHDVVEEPEKITGEVEYPALSSQEAFDSLRNTEILKSFDESDAEELATSILIRLLNIIEISNQEVGEVSVDSSVSPVFKPSKRVLTPIHVDKEGCQNNLDTSQLNTIALVWDDANDDGYPLKGDKWYFISNQCIDNSNSAYSTGVIEYSNMEDPFGRCIETDEGVTTDICLGLREEDDQNYTNRQVNLDLQIDYQNEKSVFFDDVAILLSRSIDGSDSEITDFVVNAESKMGVKSDDDLYLFEFNQLELKNDEDNENIAIKVDSKYFLRLEDSDEYLNVKTTDDLEFSYDFLSGLHSGFTNVEFISGKMEITGANESRIVFNIVDSETLSFEVDADGDGEFDETIEIESSKILDSPDFKLINITGG